MYTISTLQAITGTVLTTTNTVITLVGEVPRHRRADRPSWDGPTSAVAPRPLSLAQGEPISSK